MAENGGNHKEVPLKRIVLSNIYSIEASIDVLAEKGLVTKEEVLKRIEKVVEGRVQKGLVPYCASFSLMAVMCSRCSRSACSSISNAVLASMSSQYSPNST